MQYAWKYQDFYINLQYHLNCKIMSTAFIELIDQKAYGRLQELEMLKLIRILQRNNEYPEKNKLSDKYKNVFSVKDAMDFKEYTQHSRSEWNSNI